MTQYFFDITVIDPSGNVTVRGVQPFTMPGAVSITTTSLPNGKRGNFYTAAVTAINGVGAHTFSLNAGTLPPGLVLDPTGTLSGTPTSAGTFNFDVRVTDSGAPTSSDMAAFTVVISKKSSGDSGDEGCSTSQSNAHWFTTALMLCLLALGWRVASTRGRPHLRQDP